MAHIANSQWSIFYWALGYGLGLGMVNTLGVLFAVPDVPAEHRGATSGYKNLLSVPLSAVRQQFFGAHDPARQFQMV